MIQKFFLIIIFIVNSSYGSDLKEFLSYCGYGTAIGSGLGLASLAFEKKPNESYVNIARGASLGLYAGIALGITNWRQGESLKNKESQLTKFWFSPVENGAIANVSYEF